MRHTDDNPVGCSGTVMRSATVVILLASLGWAVPVLAQPWQVSTSGIANQAITCVAVEPQTNGRVALAGCRANSLPTLWRTSNTGATWWPVRAFADGAIPVEGIEFDPHNPLTVYVSSLYARSMWRSVDGGEQWAQKTDKSKSRASQAPSSHSDSTLIVWETVQHISTSPLQEAIPRLQASGENVFMMWAANDAAYSFFERSTDAGSSWPSPLILPDSTQPGGNWFYSSNSLVAASPYLFFTTTYQTGPNFFPHLWFRRWLITDPGWGQGVVLSDSTSDIGSIVAQGGDAVIAYWGFTGGPYFTCSADTGLTWRRLQPTLPLGGFEPRAMCLRGENLYIARTSAVWGSNEVKFSLSTDYGATWRPEMFLSSIDTLISDEPHLAADSSGSVYVLWRDAKYGSTTGFGGSIILRRSTDYGETWMAEEVLTSIPSGLFPRISVLRDRVAVAWQDEVPGSPEDIESVHFRFSADRGVTWSDEENLTADTQHNVDPDVITHQQEVHVSWAANSAPNNLDIFYRRGTVTPTGVEGKEEGPTKEMQLLQNYPNPFNGETWFRFSLGQRTRIRIDIFDVLGRRVSTILNAMKEGGEGVVCWESGAMSSGVYIVRLESGGRMIQRKILLLR